MSKLDYSKWDHIEISDDEDDTHPNVDTASLYRWRHEARMQKMQEAADEKKKLETGQKSNQQKMTEMKKKLQDADQSSEELSRMKIEMSDLEKQEQEYRNKEEELKKKEQLTPWNIDTICKDVQSKTIINKTAPKKKDYTEDEKAERQQKFVAEHKKDARQYGMLQKYDASQQFLEEHPYLVCEETANYLVIWCIDLEVEQKKDLMKHVSHQTIVMQFILELAKQMDVDPRGCVRSFFSRIKLAEKQYMDAFYDELSSFRSRVKDRAEARVQDAMEQYEQEEKEKRIGPGGLDPVEVFETLPENLKECFESKNIGMLQDRIQEMPKEDAEYHMKRCVDSGLWVPNAKDLEAAGSKSTAEDASVDVAKEVYDASVDVAKEVYDDLD